MVDDLLWPKTECGGCGGVKLNGLFAPTQLRKPAASRRCIECMRVFRARAPKAQAPPSGEKWGSDMLDTIQMRKRRGWYEKPRGL